MSHRAQRIKLTYNYGINDTVVDSPNMYMEGWIHQIHFRVPNSDNNVTATLTILDNDGYEIYNSTAQAENANYNLIATYVPLLIAGRATFRCTLSGAPGNVVAVIAVIMFDGIYYD